jgi:two-component system sensor histidine kinase BaeS
MRSIAFKLTIAFLLVGLTGAILVSVISLMRTSLAFDKFILDREKQLLVNNLVQHYEVYGNWEQVSSVLPAPAGGPPPRNFSGERDFRPDWTGFTLVDTDGSVVYNTDTTKIGQKISSHDLERAIALEANGKTIGWLLVANSPRQWIPGSPEGIFLRNITSATIVSALVASGLALILGGLLALTLTRSLRELTDATGAIARGQLGLQVKVRSKDEMGILATSFNKMSLDLQTATRARRQMTADIAHDLRSPLSVISGYAEALSDGKLPGSPEIYNVLYQETQQLSHLVEDLRTLSLADAGELTLNRQAVRPYAILEREFNRHTVTAQQKDISMRIEAPPELPQVSVDPERIAQVMDNLMLNAFRYTPTGGQITLSAGMHGDKVYLRVQDNGRGISPDDLQHIFDRFYRGDKSRQQNGESGLGLAIAKSILEAHGGSIAVESLPGEGAAFTIILDAWAV